jgi:hypothetical protein
MFPLEGPLYQYYVGHSPLSEVCFDIHGVPGVGSANVFTCLVVIILIDLYNFLAYFSYFEKIE